MNKSLYIFVLPLVCTPVLFGQVSVNTDGSQADSSAMFEVKTENKGFLPPRMTSAQMSAIDNPAEGLLIYNTDTKSFMYFNGTVWKSNYPEFLCGDQIMDIDSNRYNTVLIDNQCWMKENLKTTTFRNGTPIPNVTANASWFALSSSAYAWYGNNISWKDKYGALYNWYATVDTSGLCPLGWHVPTHSEWMVLTDYVGGVDPPNGNDLKSCRQVNSPLGGYCNTTDHPRWNQDGSEYGTDTYGFSGLPGGYRDNGGYFWDLGSFGEWWASTAQSSSNGYKRGLLSYYGGINVYGYDKRGGASIRCIRND